jgi:hypothetical protein
MVTNSKSGTDIKHNDLGEGALKIDGGLRIIVGLPKECYKDLNRLLSIAREFPDRPVSKPNKEWKLFEASTEKEAYEKARKAGAEEKAWVLSMNRYKSWNSDASINKALVTLHDTIERDLLKTAGHDILGPKREAIMQRISDVNDLATLIVMRREKYLAREVKEDTKRVAEIIEAEGKGYGVAGVVNGVVYAYQKQKSSITFRVNGLGVVAEPPKEYLDRLDKFLEDLKAA